MNNGKDIVKRAAVSCLGIGLIVIGINFSAYAEQERSEEQILTEELQNYYKMHLSGFNNQYQDLACSINVCRTVAKENEERFAALKYYEYFSFGTEHGGCWKKSTVLLQLSMIFMMNAEDAVYAMSVNRDDE